MNAHSLIDSHCHPPAAAAAEWIARAREAGVGELIAVGTESSDWSRHAATAAAHPGTVHWTAGLHPCHVAGDAGEQLAALEHCLAAAGAPPPCALGEIGLDFTRLPKEGRGEIVALQREAFVRQLRLARELDLPVVVHSRGTVAECLAVIRESGFPGERALFHCFAEGPASLEAVRAAGARCSFTGIVTFRNAAEVREALRISGPGSLILETDSPYLSPEPHRGKPNEPARLADIAAFCARFFEIDPAELARTTAANTRAFFRLDAPGAGGVKPSP
ncbi:MAG: TatD family hydrolase [Puniceicoccaceae bacterium]